MNKGQIAVIIGAAVLLLGLFLLSDTTPEPKEPTGNTVSTGFSMPQYISGVIDHFTEKEKTTVLSLQDNVGNSDIDQRENYQELVRFFVNQGHAEVAAYYAYQDAALAQTDSTWEDAGDISMFAIASGEHLPSITTFLDSIARFSYTKVMENNPSHDLQVKLARTYLVDEEEVMTGIQMLLEVVKEDSMHPPANFTLGQYGMISGQYEKAATRFKKVLSLQPQNGEALLMMAEALVNTGKTTEALEVLRHHLSIMEDEEWVSIINKEITRLESIP